MRNRSKLLLTGLTAALVLAAAVSTASARNLSVNTREFRAIWSELSFSGGGSTIVCAISLLGSYHRSTIAKSAGALIGSLTSVTLGTCQGDGKATVLQETLPWHLTYRTFTGELPELTGIGLNLVNAAFRIEDGIACLARTDTTEPAGAMVNVDPVTGVVDGFSALSEFLIDLDDPGFLCDLAGDASFSGRGTVTTAAGGSVVFDLI